MKTFVSTIITTAVLASLGETVTRGQEQAVIEEAVTAVQATTQQHIEHELDHVSDYARLRQELDSVAVLTDAALAPALAAVEESLARIEAEALPAVEAALAQVSERSRDQLRAQQQVQQVLALAQAAPQPGATPATPVPAFHQRLQKVVGRGRANARTLVIRSADTDAKTQANLEEDLAVMSRVLDKALEQKLSGERRNVVMGIDMLFSPGTGPIRSVYLEDYGALFLLNVNFPLLPPPEKPEQTKEKSEADSTWEEAKRELYGQQDFHSGVWNQYQKTFKLATEFGAGSEYDESKVEKLKDALVEALKNAANIRNLKPDETITVCVFGGASPARAKAKVLVKRAPDSADEDRDEAQVGWIADDGSSTRGTIMTIRVKRSDVDGFAKGKLSLDDFRKKARITTYAGDAGGLGGFGGALFGAAP